MPRILIISASTGQGHNQAANTLKNEFEASGYIVDIVEPFKEEGHIMDALIEDGYSIMATKLPRMYGRLYRIAYYRYINKGLVAVLNKTMGQTIFHLVQEYKPDLLISTHPFFVNVVSYLKAARKITQPFISVVTDYLAHQIYINEFVDAYIVGSNYTKENLIAKGIIDHKIYVYGIPVRQEFRQPRVPHNSRLFTLLLMGGGLGIPFIKKCLQKLMENTHRIRILVVCGNNQKLRRELEEKYRNNINHKELIIYGFTQNIPELMDQSDIIVTKPGGLTVTEALYKNVPILIPYFLPGQEEENTEILVKAGVAIRANISELNYVIDLLYNNPDLLGEMSLKARQLFQELSPGCVVQLADKLIFDYQNRVRPNHSLIGLN